MLYLSQVLGRPIRDLEGLRVASVRDVMVRLGGDDPPPVRGLVARYRRRDCFLSRWRITELNEHGVRLNSDILDLRPFVRRESEVLLARDVLDKQLIDVDGKRVVRVTTCKLFRPRETGASLERTSVFRDCGVDSRPLDSQEHENRSKYLTGPTSGTSPQTLRPCS